MCLNVLKRLAFSSQFSTACNSAPLPSTGKYPNRPRTCCWYQCFHPDLMFMCVAQRLCLDIMGMSDNLKRVCLAMSKSLKFVHP